VGCVDRHTQLHRSSRSSALDLDPESAWRVVAGAGPGEHWYVDAAPLVVRGALDRLVGGAGRRWPVPEALELATGDRAGFWRVLEAAPRRRVLRLAADVVSPGSVLLTVEVGVGHSGTDDSGADEGCTVTTRIAFEPDGLAGQLYMLADLPAREAVVELVHRRLVDELTCR
jgi:alkylhydroperoxidase family enzyme